MSQQNIDRTGQNMTILRALRRRELVTGQTALQRYGIYRLSSCIRRLRNQGHIIVTVMRFKNGGSFASYRLR